jgi:hypothetical protein
VTEPNLHQEGQAAGQMLERSRLRLGLDPQTLGGGRRPWQGHRLS